jgi:PST family polysaccharide transporter
MWSRLRCLIWRRLNALTSIQTVLASFAIILIDLFGRAVLDKALALTGGPAVVAQWAQLQSVLDVISGVAIAGVMQGLTVLVTQVREQRDERNLLQSALKVGLCTSLAVALMVVLAIPALASWRSWRKIEPALILLAACAGCIAVIPAALSAYWLGKHQQQRMLRLALLVGTVWLTVAVGAWQGLSLRGMILIQFSMLSIIGSLLWRYMRKLSQVGDRREGGTEYFSKLLKFVPVGLAIGIMSPASMLLMRGMLSDMLSWDDVGFLQALWRSTEWVTATAAGVLSLVFLPRLSSAYGSMRFKTEINFAGLAVLVPAACMLLLVYFNQRGMLATLYDARFVVSNETAALFMLGCWIRIASWVFLFGLFATHRIWTIIVGEVLSLPLFVFMLWLFSNGMTLERMALLYLVSYLVYLGFNAIALLYSLRNQTAIDEQR